MSDDDKKKQVEEVWAKYDTDGSGKLEKAEALTFLRDTFKQIFGSDQTDEQLESTFNMVDMNKNGAIEKEELLKHIGGLLDGEADVD